MTRMRLLLPAVGLLLVACSTGATGSASQPVAVASPSAAPQRSIVVESGSAAPAPASAIVTWDGKGCSYAGPTEIPRGTLMTFAFVGTPGSADIEKDQVAMLFYHVDDGITLADVTARLKENPKGSDIPPWVDQSEIVGPLYPEWAAKGETMTHAMTSNRYLVSCATKADDGMHPAALIVVKDR